MPGRILRRPTTPAPESPQAMSPDRQVTSTYASAPTVYPTPTSLALATKLAHAAIPGPTTPAPATTPSTTTRRSTAGARQCKGEYLGTRMAGPKGPSNAIYVARRRPVCPSRVVPCHIHPEVWLSYWADFLLPGLRRLEVLAVALRDEWQLATRLANQEYCEEYFELLNGLAAQIAKNHKAAPSDDLVASVKALLDWEGKLRIAGKEMTSGNGRKAMERLQKCAET